MRTGHHLRIFKASWKKSLDSIFLQAFSSGADVSLNKEEWIKGLSVFMVVTIFNKKSHQIYTGRHSRRAYTILLQCIWHKVGTQWKTINFSFHLCFLPAAMNKSVVRKFLCCSETAFHSKFQRRMGKKVWRFKNKIILKACNLIKEKRSGFSWDCAKKDGPRQRRLHLLQWLQENSLYCT